MAADRREVFGVAGLAALLTAAPALARPPRSEAPGDADERRDLPARFFKRLDALNRGIAFGRPPTDNPWDLMTPDGAWSRDGRLTASRAEFDAAIAGLPTGLVTVHVVGNLTLEAASAGEAVADFVLTISSGRAAPPKTAAAFDLPGAILKAQAVLALAPGGWRIRRMDSETLFHG